MDDDTMNLFKNLLNRLRHPHGILSGESIEKAVRSGRVRISPYNPAHINPASYDVTLGPEVAVYSDVVLGGFESSTLTGNNLRPNAHGSLDAARDNAVKRHVLEPGGPILLRPGIGYLMHTKERIWSEDYVPVLDGKSSIGRLFAVIHVTAGYGDPGFDGQYTLEVTVTHPLVLYEGMRIGQIRFHTTCGKPRPYASHKSTYVGNLAVGPVPSRAWAQMQMGRQS